MRDKGFVRLCRSRKAVGSGGNEVHEVWSRVIPICGVHRDRNTSQNHSDSELKAIAHLEQEICFRLICNWLFEFESVSRYCFVMQGRRLSASTPIVLVPWKSRCPRVSRFWMGICVMPHIDNTGYATLQVILILHKSSYKSWWDVRLWLREGMKQTCRTDKSDLQSSSSKISRVVSKGNVSSPRPGRSVQGLD